MGDPMPAELEEFLLEVKEDMFPDGVDFDPDFPKKLFIDNVIKRTLSTLMAKGSQKYYLLRCTNAGYLKVSTVGSALDNEENFNYSNQGTSDTQSFTQTVSRLLVIITQGNAKIKFSYDGTTYGAYHVIGDAGFAVFERSIQKFTIDKYTTNFYGDVIGLY